MPNMVLIGSNSKLFVVDPTKYNKFDLLEPLWYVRTIWSSGGHLVVGGRGEGER